MRSPRALDADSRVEVTLDREDPSARPILSLWAVNDIALDVARGRCSGRARVRARTIAVGNLGGVATQQAAANAILRLYISIDAASGVYNKHLLTPGLALVTGLAAHAGLCLSSPRRAALRAVLAEAALRAALA